MKEKNRHRFKVLKLASDAGGRVLELEGVALGEPLPLKHPDGHGWLRFDSLRLSGDPSRGYRIDFLFEEALIRSDFRRPPAVLLAEPADLVSWLVMSGWRKSDLLVYVPALEGTPLVYYYPNAIAVRNGRARRSVRRAGPQPLLMAPEG